MNEKKIFQMLGLAFRAGKLASGEFSVESAVKEGKAYLVIVAQDASENTVKLFSDKCAFYQVPMERAGDKESLGRALGKEVRASIAVLDEGLANKIKELIEESRR
jgi:ribosomal protein L7Ae-like RNA K-turn-binding protein